MIEAEGPSMKLASTSVVVAATQHVDAVPHARDGRFNGLPIVERGAKFERRTVNVVVRISLQPAREILDPAEESVDLHERHAHGCLATNAARSAATNCGSGPRLTMSSDVLR